MPQQGACQGGIDLTLRLAIKFSITRIEALVAPNSLADDGRESIAFVSVHPQLLSM